MAIAVYEPTLFDSVLYYGLFLAAIFQLVCILAVVYIPQSENQEEDAEEVPDNKTTAQSPQSFMKKGGKKEKKKYR